MPTQCRIPYCGLPCVGVPTCGTLSEGFLFLEHFNLIIIHAFSSFKSWFMLRFTMPGSLCIHSIFLTEILVQLHIFNAWWDINTSLFNLQILHHVHVNRSYSLPGIKLKQHHSELQIHVPSGKSILLGTGSQMNAFVHNPWILAFGGLSGLLCGVLHTIGLQCLWRPSHRGKTMILRPKP